MPILYTLIYCVESWGNAPKCHLDQLYILYRTIVRLVTFSNCNKDLNIPSQYIFRELHVLPLYNLVHNTICLLMYKIVNGFLPEIMSESYTGNNEVYDHFTRQSHVLHTRKENNHVSIQSFSNTVPRIWNSIYRHGKIYVIDEQKVQHVG